jgi:ABC-2 type transport system ATP-binding protein
MVSRPVAEGMERYPVVFPHAVGTMPAHTTPRHVPLVQTTEPAVRARGVVRRFGDLTAVDQLDLDVRSGTIFGFIGPSGSGKSTTIRLLTGIDHPDEGEVTVLGSAPARFSAAERARLGYMPQLSVLFPTLSLRENLSFVASIYGMPLRRKDTMREMLELVELYDERRTRLQDASGGMQRRLALAAALLHEPELLFLDEPTAGIDPVLRRKFWEHFTNLRDDGRTLFVTTQYVTEAAYCDVVGVIARGRLIAVAPPEELRRSAFGGDLIDVSTGHPLSDTARAALGDVEGVSRVERTHPDGRQHRVVVHDAGAALPAIQSWLERRDLRVQGIRQHVPPFDDVFVELVTADRDSEEDATADDRLALSTDETPSREAHR